MRLRSGHVYGVESREAEDDTDEVRFIDEFHSNEDHHVAMPLPIPLPIGMPMSMPLRPMQMINPTPIRIEGMTAKTLRFIKLGCHFAAQTVWKIVKIIPTGLAAAAGVHAIHQAINPPERHIHIKIVQNTTWW